MSTNYVLGTKIVTTPAVWSQLAYSTALASARPRPTDWLAVPAYNNAIEKIVGLYAVMNDDSNYLAVTVAGAYTIDWGDGIIENYATGMTCYHQYTYSGISSATLSTRGYRQVLVVITPQAANNLTSFDLGVKHTAFASGSNATGVNWLDISVSCPNIVTHKFVTNTSGSATTTAPLCERITLSKVVTGVHLFNGLKNLRTIAIGNSSSVTSTSYMFANCCSLLTVPLINTSAATDLSYMFANCTAMVTVPLFVTTSALILNNMFSGCVSLQTVPLFNTFTVTSMNYMFSNCYSLQTTPSFDMNTLVNMSYMFSNCYSLQTVPLFNCNRVNNASFMFSCCYSLQSVPLLDLWSVFDESYMFQQCLSLQTIPAFNTWSSTNMSNMFAYCSSLQTIPLLASPNVTNMTGMFTNCSELTSALTTVMAQSIDFSNTKISRTGFIAIFNALSTVTGKTITITNALGALSLTVPDRLIAINKGWTVTG